MAKDYYDILGVSKSASQDDIKKAFRKLAHEHHPDKGNGNADKFKEINEAYQTLGNEGKRKQYDQFGQSFGHGGANGFNYQDFARQQGGNPFGQGGFSQGGVNFDFGDLGDLGDIFGSFFGGGGSRKQSTRGRDIEMEMTIDFEEAVFGTEKNIDLAKKIVCDRCGGNGAEPGSKVNTCKTCGGRGRVSKIQQTIFGNFQAESVCPDCHGEGQSYEKKCSQCHGSGTVSGSEKIKIKVPAGIVAGQSIKLTSKGEAGPQGHNGDLYIRVKIHASREFKREGDEILTEEHISVKQAILGDKIEVETVDGPVRLKIPEGTQSHSKFRIREKGVPHLNRRGRGDHIVEIIVDIPRGLSRAKAKQLEDLGI